jgi:RND superfamily putative drug exporter
VATGLQRTGGIITAAALLMIVIGGFAAGGAATIQMLGVGTLVAVAVDATLVRTLLVPASMRLLGRWTGGPGTAGPDVQATWPARGRARLPLGRGPRRRWRWSVTTGRGQLNRR